MKHNRTYAALAAAAIAALLCLSAPARAADGLTARDLMPDGSNHWRSRLSLSVDGNSPWATSLGSSSGGSSTSRAASVVADYYFTNPAGGGRTAGFRASGGVGFASQGAAWLGRMPLGTATSPAGSGIDPLRNARGDGGTLTFPYVGVGYSGIYPRSGWGFTADFGLMGMPSSYAPGYGLRVDGGSSGAFDGLGRMRPVVQVGVSYSF